MVPVTTPPSLEVEISDTQGHMKVAPEMLARLARGVLAGEKILRASISIALVDNATIRTMNRRHLDHDWPTDVISFRLSEPDEAVLAGELIVSAEMARATAREAGIDPAAELALYVVHGLLHLCGYDDTSDEDVERIRRREDEVLAREGVSNTFPLVRAAGSGEGERESVRWSD